MEFWRCKQNSNGRFTLPLYPRLTNQGTNRRSCYIIPLGFKLGKFLSVQPQCREWAFPRAPQLSPFPCLALFHRMSDPSKTVPEKRAAYKMATFRKIFAKWKCRLSAKISASGPALPGKTINTNQTLIESANADSNRLSAASISKKSKREGYRSAEAPLENLPPEVRRHLLFIMDFESLKTLVHASPVYHEQYLLERRLFLCDLLAPELHMVTSDACAVDQSSTRDFSRRRARKEYVMDFLKDYRNQHVARHTFHVDRSFSLPLLGRMASFHFSVIQPLARYYHEWALANFAKETGVPTSHEPLSKTEKIRLMRGLYRFQLCCNLFGRGRHGIPPDTELEMDQMDILEHFICIFEPWEVEEICCIYTFANAKYEQIFDDISWDVNENNPKFDGERPPTQLAHLILRVSIFFISSP